MSIKIIFRQVIEFHNRCRERLIVKSSLLEISDVGKRPVAFEDLG